jgi:transcriptional regulator GlxA family with amidase domain
MILYKRDIEKLKQIQEHINSNLDQDLRLKAICEKFNLSSAKLRRHFSFYFKKPIHHYILETRLNKALELLCCYSQNIPEVALCVGYKDRCSFTHAFAKFFGQPPLVYLKSQQLEIENLLENLGVSRKDT